MYRLYYTSMPQSESAYGLFYQGSACMVKWIWKKELKF